MKKYKKPSDLKHVSTDDLLPGDIILYHGKGIVARLIRFFDRSYVNHAGIYIGGKKIIEAVGEGVKEKTVSDSLNKEENSYVVIKRLRNAPSDMSPVVDVAKMYKKSRTKYEFRSIVFLAVISLVGRVHKNRPVAWMVTKMLKQYFSRYLKNSSDQPMICSELAYRCYNEAVGADEYDFTFLVDTMPMIRSVYTVGSESSLADRRGLVSAALDAAGVENREYGKELSKEKSESVMTGIYESALKNKVKEEKDKEISEEAQEINGGKNLVNNLCKTIPHFVTPRDILCSPSLETKGIILLK